MKSLTTTNGLQSQQQLSRLVPLALEFLLILIVCQIPFIQGTLTNFVRCDPDLSVAENLNCHCNSSEIKCADGTECYPIKLYCDGWEDCYDSSDEAPSCKEVCPGQSVRCNVTGFCMNPAQFCDNITDCPDNSDEKNCGECPKNRFQCRSSKQCIPNIWLCDGYSDCSESEDETTDLCGSCKIDELQCTGNKTMCIPLSQKCDGKTQCPGGSDEQGCVVTNDDDKQSLRTCLSPLQFRFAGHEAYKVCSTNWTERMSQRTCQRFSLGKAVKTELDVNITAENRTLTVTSKVNENEPNLYEYLTKNETCSSGKGVRVVCETVECGVLAKTIKVDSGQYIINGQLAKRGANPWQVLIEQGSQVCGGSIIKDRWILTAAHCAVAFKRVMTDTKVFAGSIRRYLNSIDPDEKQYTVDKIILHPEYAEDHKRDVIIGDVALMRLTSHVEFTETILPICLPGKNDRIERYKICVSTGFGLEKYTEQEIKFVERGRYRSLMVGRMQAKSKENCLRNYHDIYGNKWNITEDELEKVVCGGEVRIGQGTAAACRGDSGGPLACNDYRGIWTLVGVTSFGVEKCSMSVFARVSYYQDWIEQIISENSLD